MTIGENLKKLRIERGLTQEETAEIVGINQSMIAQLEIGSEVLTVPLALVFAKEFDVDITTIVCCEV